jgi:GT2 family glycosyltransferase
VDEEHVLAPPVVAVVVVHSPGPWFDETLASLARQDYPNLNAFFLIAGDPLDADGNDIAARIRGHLPDAFVEALGSNPGFGPAANVVLDSVEGDNGFFCLCHDDVALDPDAVRLMVEELYRSNAGIIGPKLVDWDNPRELQNVGLDVDRYGQPASIVDPGEVDQEQHDAVTDVFAVPSACLLVRADLFRTLGGFDPAMNFYGEDVDLCWRAHIGGARVIIAPAARARHRAQLQTRRPDLNHPGLRSRHGLRSTLTLTAGARLPLRLVELVALTILEFGVGLFTGHVREAWSALRALLASIPRFPTLLARRGTIAKLRRVSDAEVHDLQSRGSNRLRSFRRSRDTQLFIGVEENIRRWRERSIAPIVTWTAIILAVLVASRSFINRSVPSIGEFVPFPESPRGLWREYVSGWNPNGLGDTAANPTGWAVLAAGSVLWLFHMSLGLTMTVVGSVLVGALGVWRLTDLFPSNRERVVAVVTYVAMPLLPGVISTGRLGAVIAFAALPWFVHLIRLAAGIGTADPESVAADLPDGVTDLDTRERVRRTAVAGIIVAVSVAIAPPLLIVVAGVTLVLGVTTLLVGAGWRTGAWMTLTGAAACAVGWVLNLPASTAWSWNDLTAIPLAGAEGRGLTDVASMNIGRARLGLLALALYVPVFTGLAISRAWRLSWAARAAGLVVTFGTLAVMQDRDAAPIRLPDAGLLLVPVALGLAIATACAVASFVSDVAGQTFGWRQPVGLLSIAAVLCGMFPALLTLTDGGWFAPRTTLSTMLGPQLEADEFGDFRVLYLGDPRVIPVAARDLGGGLAMAITGPGAPDFRDRFVSPSTPAEDSLRRALTDIAGGATQRGGRLLAPYAIRYIVVPRFDGANSIPDEPIALPRGLTDALGAQLDLDHRFTSPNFEVYENRAAFPAVALLSGPLASAVDADSSSDLVGRDLSAAPPALGSVLEERRASDDIEAGVLHVAVPFDGHWTLRAGQDEIPARPGFGVLTAFDVPSATSAELDYDTPSSRTNALFGQGALWLIVFVAASRLRVPGWVSRGVARRGRGAAVIELGAGIELPTEGGEVPVMVPLEPVADVPSAPLFRADDAESRAAWVDEMFAGEQEDQEEQEEDLGVAHESREDAR